MNSKIWLYICLLLVSFHSVSCFRKRRSKVASKKKTKNTESRPKRLEGEALIESFAKAIGGAKTSETRKHVYLDGRFKEVYGTEILNLLGLANEDRLVSKYLESQYTGNIIKRYKLVQSCTGQSDKEKRSRLINAFLDELHDAKGEEMVGTKFDLFLQLLEPDEEKLLLNNLDRDTLRKECQNNLQTCIAILDRQEKQILKPAARLKPLISSSYSGYLTSYPAIAIYCALGIVATIGSYFIYFKDVEEEHEL